MELEKTKCPICELSNEKLIFEILEIRLVECQKCGLIYLNPRIKKEDIMKYYPHTYYSKGNKIKKILEDWLTRMSNLRRFLTIYQYKRAGRILDLGCGTGKFLERFNPKHWLRYGVEPNPVGYEIAVSKSGFKICSEELIDCHFPSFYFDVVTAWNVLEHIHNPRETLTEVKRILKEKGIFILSTPNVGGFGFKITKEHWFHLDFPRHFYLFNRFTLEKLLNLVGLKIVRINYVFWEYPLDLFHSIVNSKLRLNFLRCLFILPILILTLIAKPLLSLFKLAEEIEIICVKIGD